MTDSTTGASVQIARLPTGVTCMKLFVGALAVTLLAGCATSPVPSSEADPVPSSRLFAYQAPTQGDSSLIVTRDKGFVGGAATLW